MAIDVAIGTFITVTIITELVVLAYCIREFVRNK